MILYSSCNKDFNKDAEEYEVHISGKAEYYIDSLLWLGGECDPSSFILTNYKWFSGEPDYPHSRIYISGKADSSYLFKEVEIKGELSTITGGGVESGLRTFPLVIAETINVK